MSKIKEIHIFDFDGTLVDSSHRYKTQICEDGVERIDLQYWLDNENQADKDTPIEANCEFYRSVVADPKKYALIATARLWCDKAEKVCIDNDLVPNGLIARKDRNDTRGGAAIKITHVKRLLNLKQFANVEKIHIHEDNIDYLKAIQCEFNAVSHFYPSNQGY